MILDAPAVSDALTRLTDPAYNLTTIGKVVSKTTTVVTRATSKLQMKPDEAPIPSVLLNDLLLVSIHIFMGILIIRMMGQKLEMCFT